MMRCIGCIANTNNYKGIAGRLNENSVEYPEE